MGIFEEMASGAEVIGAVDPNDPMSRVKRCSYIVLRSDRQMVRKLGVTTMRRFLAVEEACRSVGLGFSKPAVINEVDWRWMEEVFEASETQKYDPGPEKLEQMREQAKKATP